MLNIEIHGFGTEKAAGLREEILKNIFNISWIDKNLDSIEICGDDIIGYSREERTHLRLLTSYADWENELIIAKLAQLSIPIHIIHTQSYEG